MPTFDDLEKQISDDLERAVDMKVYGPQVGAAGLNETKVLESRVRHFAAHALTTRGDWRAGKIAGGQAVDRLMREAEEVAHLLMGHAPGYATIPWFSAGQLGRFLVRHFSLDCPPEEAPVVVLMRAAVRLGETADAGEAGAMPGYLAQHRIDEVVHALVDAFLGVDREAVEAVMAEAAGKAKAGVARSMTLDQDERHLAAGNQPPVVLAP